MRTSFQGSLRVGSLLTLVAVPRISEFYGIAIYMYYEDASPRMCTRRTADKERSSLFVQRRSSVDD